MADLVKRFSSNPIITPAMVRPSRDELAVQGVLNPGAFRFGGRIGLILRVAERAEQDDEMMRVPTLDPSGSGELRILSFHRSDPGLALVHPSPSGRPTDTERAHADPRGLTYHGSTYLTTLSHLRLAWSNDGTHFEVEEKPMLVGHGPLESFGIEDCRVTEIDGVFHLTYTAVSPDGAGVGLATTHDWKTFQRPGMVLPPANKDFVLFPELVDGLYVALHRPTYLGMGGGHIWLARSSDLVNWGGHKCVLRPRMGKWDSNKVGAGAAPIRTPEGWLNIFHASDEHNRYALGAALHDLDDPSRILARTDEPIMQPTKVYERRGFYGDVVFTNGHVVDGDTISVYYGAADEVVCGGTVSISEILGVLDAQRMAA